MPKSNSQQQKNMPSSIFSQTLRFEIERSGLKQQDIAALAGCTQSDISRWLKGRIPSGDKLVALAKALGCQADYLIHGFSPGDMPIVRDSPADDYNDWKKRALAAEKKLAALRAILFEKDDIKP